MKYVIFCWGEVQGLDAVTSAGAAGYAAEAPALEAGSLALTLLPEAQEGIHSKGPRRDE